MSDVSFKGKVAVITGGASGIGRAMAERFAEEGMRIVLADVEGPALERAEAEMKGEGAEVLAVRCDVSKAHDMKALAAKAVERFDTVHILCNNAGVGIPGRTWEIDLADWEWVLGVNLWGVIYGVHYFVPVMLENGDRCHIVNTASMAGLTSGGHMAPYHVSKHGVVTLSEGLFHEFNQMEANIGVSVLCPGWVNTRINESDRNRPAGEILPETLGAEGQMFRQMVSTALSQGLTPREVAELTFESVRDNVFYVLPHAHWKNMIRSRMEDIIEQRSPTIMLPPELMG
jgi:NAD(P)-dependent dehydrogenase (short-subunit alcohol dehydrogenase family)